MHYHEDFNRHAFFLTGTASIPPDDHPMSYVPGAEIKVADESVIFVPDLAIADRAGHEANAAVALFVREKLNPEIAGKINQFRHDADMCLIEEAIDLISDDHENEEPSRKEPERPAHSHAPSKQVLH